MRAQFLPIPTFMLPLASSMQSPDKRRHCIFHSMAAIVPSS